MIKVTKFNKLFEKSTKFSKIQNYIRINNVFALVDIEELNQFDEGLNPSLSEDVLIPFIKFEQFDDLTTNSIYQYFLDHYNIHSLFTILQNNMQDNGEYLMDFKDNTFYFYPLFSKIPIDKLKNCLDIMETMASAVYYPDDEDYSEEESLLDINLHSIYVFQTLLDAYPNNIIIKNP